jgi:signal transduction histidine kinase
VPEHSPYDRLPEAVVVVAADGTVTLVNDRSRVLLGLPHDVVGKHLDDVLDLRDDAGVRCAIAGARPRLGDRLPERVLHVSDDGRRRAIAIAGRWHDDELVITARSAGRREALDAVRGDVVATVSHEIRSPLTSVKGFTRTLLARWDRFSDEQKRAMLETVDADADRVTRLLRELLDVSRIDAGRVQLHRRPVDLAAIVTATADKAAHRDLGRDRRIDVEVERDLPPVVADPDKVEQVVTNLLENALAYAPDSPVWLRLACVDGSEMSPSVRLSVVDHGPGVEPDQRRTIFKKFGRGRDNRRAGTGLGLYISRGLVEAHGGEVWLDESTPAGATFHASFPVGEPEL